MNPYYQLKDGWIVPAKHVPSPNFNQRPRDVVINTIVIHGISLPPNQFGGNDILDFFANKLDIGKHPAYASLEGVEVSAHFLIRRNGELIQFVSTHKRAWHAGKSIWQGRPDCNNYSIGIELEGADQIPYSTVQYQQLALLINCLMQYYPQIQPDRIIGHADIAPSRKTDPGPAFEWAYLFRLLQPEDKIMQYQGNILKMQTRLSKQHEAIYQLPIGEQTADVNSWLGKEVEIEHLGEIHCIACGRKSNKSFAQGFCYPCFRSLPQCDSCIMSPEKCHFAEGTCRDESWAKENCMQDHFVYLSLTAGVKVGITRGSQIPTRWIDQGAVAALPIIRVSQRYYSGLVEVLLKKFISDRTSWQKMLKGDIDDIDLQQSRKQLLQQAGSELHKLQAQYPDNDIEWLENNAITQIQYPVLQYPEKVKSFNLDKDKQIKGRLMGIKGQYLIFDGGVINLRKYSGYRLKIHVRD